MKKFYALLAGGALLALANTSYAAQPLSDGQMDHVTAGLNVTAIADAASVVLGDTLGTTVALTSTNADPVDHLGVAQSYSQGIAAGLLSQAASISGSDSYVSFNGF